MAVIVKDNGGDFAPAPEGSSVARCIQVIELGTQTFEWQGKSNSKFNVSLGFELVNELSPDTGKPFITYVDYTASLNKEASLRKHISAWRGRDFSDEEIDGYDLTVLLGKPCLVSIEHKTSSKGRTYGKIVGITKIPKELTEIPVQTNELLSYEIKNGEDETFKKLPEYIQAKIKLAPEFAAAKSAPVFSEFDHTNEPAF